MPDIDIDFDERRRGDVIRYVTEKYGDDRVAQIITYGTIKAKAAVKDSARVLGFPYALGDRITKAFPPPVMGKDVPLSGIFDDEAPPVRRGGRDPRALRGRSRGQASHRHRARPGGSDPPGGRARSRGDHEQRAAHRPHPGLAARGRRRHHHPVRLPGVRGPRAAQDGLPGPAQPDRTGGRRRRDQGQPGPAGRAGAAPAGRQADLRAAGAGRHARGVPARRRADAGAFAEHAGGPVRGHRRGQRPLPAGPDGRQRAQRVRRPQGRPQAGHPHPPGAGRAAGRDPGRHLRADRLPGAGDGHRAEAGRLHPRQGRPAAQGDGQEEEGGAGQGVRAVRGRDEGERLLRLGHPGDLGCPGPVLRLRVQPGARGLLRDDRVLDRLPEGELPGRVHGGAAHLGLRRQGQERPVPERVPPDGHHRAAPGRERLGGHLHPGRRRHPVRPGRGAQRGHQRGRRGRGGPRRPRARSPASATSCARSRSTCATSGSSSR